MLTGPKCVLASYESGVVRFSEPRLAREIHNGDLHHIVAYTKIAILY